MRHRSPSEESIECEASGKVMARGGVRLRSIFERERTSDTISLEAEVAG